MTIPQRQAAKSSELKPTVMVVSQLQGSLLVTGVYGVAMQYDAGLVTSWSAMRRLRIRK